MKKALTRKQEESYQCILRYTNEHGYPPTIREFGKLIGVKSTSSAFSRIKQLEQNGYIRRIPASPRAIESFGKTDSWFPYFLHGRMEENIVLTEF